jgi:hypothetical protein
MEEDFVRNSFSILTGFHKHDLHTFSTFVHDVLFCWNLQSFMTFCFVGVYKVVYYCCLKLFAGICSDWMKSLRFKNDMFEPFRVLYFSNVHIRYLFIVLRNLKLWAMYDYGPRPVTHPATTNERTTATMTTTTTTMKTGLATPGRGRTD